MAQHLTDACAYRGPTPVAIDTSPARQEIVQALNHAATNLGVEIIAEGIETEEEARTCLRLGCQLGQGFLFGRPQPLAFHHSPTLVLARP